MYNLGVWCPNEVPAAWLKGSSTANQDTTRAVHRSISVLAMTNLSTRPLGGCTQKSSTPAIYRWIYKNVSPARLLPMQACPRFITMKNAQAPSVRALIRARVNAPFTHGARLKSVQAVAPACGKRAPIEAGHPRRDVLMVRAILVRLLGGHGFTLAGGEDELPGQGRAEPKGAEPCQWASTAK